VPSPSLQLRGYEVADDKNRTITKKYIEENFAAMHVELTAEESQHIRDLVEKASVFGDRWPPEHGLGLFADTPLPEQFHNRYLRQHSTEICTIFRRDLASLTTRSLVSTGGKMLEAE
jgi:hypothetical protein